MFCKYCGMKMESASNQCPHCKKEQDILQATTGYFGILSLVNQQKEVILTPKPDESKEQIKYETMKKENADLKRKIQKYEQAMKYGRYITLLAGIILLVGVVASVILYVQNRKELNKILARQEEMEKMIIDNQLVNDSVLQNYKTLLTQKETALRKEIDTCVEEMKEELNVEEILYKVKLGEIQNDLLVRLQGIEELIYQHHDEGEAVGEASVKKTDVNIKVEEFEESKDTEESTEGQINE